MKNEELLCRHGSRLNPFTTALRDRCIAQGKVLVRMRGGDWREVMYVLPDAEDEHPYDDCPHGGFRCPDHNFYWLANGESITGDRFDLVEFEGGGDGAAAPAASAETTAAPKLVFTDEQRSALKAGEVAIRKIGGFDYFADVLETMLQGSPKTSSALDFIREFVEAWELGMAGDGSLLNKARAVLQDAEKNAG